jgi:hypothetical protein
MVKHSTQRSESGLRAVFLPSGHHKKDDPFDVVDRLSRALASTKKTLEPSRLKGFLCDIDAL